MKTPTLFDWRDKETASAGFQMATDEALFNETITDGIARTRWYLWAAPAVTVGYFHKTREIPLQGAVRRMTGGGIVEHGPDITFVLCIPAHSEAARSGAANRYRWVHECLRAALASAGMETTLETPTPAFSGGACFQNPVEADLIHAGSGLKICGGAQRRSRGSIIHQGSIRLPHPLIDLSASWIDDFLHRISDSVQQISSREQNRVRKNAILLKESRYSSHEWNQRL